MYRNGALSSKYAAKLLTSERAMRLFKRFDGIRSDAAAALVLVVLVIAAFGITATFGFVDYDDQEVVFNNPFVSAGLTWTGLRWAWGLESRPDTPDWFNWPLTWMTHQADCQAYGLWAGGHHVTNIMLHAGGTVAIFAFLRTLPFSLGTAFVLAAIYGIHPAQIESVAWITSRKNVLSALFFFGSLYAFMRAHHAAGSRSSIPATLAWNALGMAALLSKATVATLPLVLLLADWWPLRRIRSASGLWRCIQEKLFLLAFSVWTVVIGYRAQNSAGAIHTSEPLLSRLEHAVQAVAAYLWMFISPVHLSPLYLCPEDSFFLTVTLAYGLLIGSITMVALGVARRSPGFTFGWLWFLLTLAPTVGLIPFGGQAWACRHLQIPMAGLLIAGASVCVAATLRCRPSVQRLGWAAAVILIGSSALLTVRQLPIWRDAPSLAQAMLAHNPRDASQWNNFAIVLDRHAAAPPAIIDDLFQHAKALPAAVAQRIEIAHDHGLFLLKLDEDERACQAFRQCLRQAELADQMKSRVATNATTNLAVGLTRLQKADEAISLLRALHDRVPATATSLNALGNAFAAGHYPGDALVAFEQALGLAPNDVLLLCNAAQAAARVGNEPLARRYLAHARASDPESVAVTAAAAILDEAR